MGLIEMGEMTFSGKKATSKNQQPNTKKLRAEVVEARVPQGLVLSATLVLIFIKDLLDLKFKCQINAFAEDVSFSTLGLIQI